MADQLPELRDSAGTVIFPSDIVLWKRSADDPGIRAVVYILLPDGTVQLDREGGGEDADMFAPAGELTVVESYISRLLALDTKEQLLKLVQAAEYMILEKKSAKKREKKPSSAGKSEKQAAAEPVMLEDV